jgi:AcrR family transcriptional regulator
MARQSLRERQRLEVREELQRASLKLFQKHGFDNVAIGDVAEHVGVAERTFYRHFPTKEDVVLSLLDEFAPSIHEHMRNHPAGDVPWKVLHEAFVDAVKARDPVEPGVMRMIYETPRLLSAYFERQRQWEAMVAEVLADRLGVDPVRDARPALWSTIAFQIATRVSFENVMIDPHADLLKNFEQRFHDAEEFFSGHLP